MRIELPLNNLKREELKNSWQAWNAIINQITAKVMLSKLISELPKYMHGGFTHFYLVMKIEHSSLSLSLASGKNHDFSERAPRR